MEGRALIALIIIIVIFAALSDNYLTAGNLTTITKQVAFNAIIALGMLLVILNGGIDLSVGSLLAFCGMVAAVESGYPQREVARSSYRFQQQVESKEKIIVGVNEFVQQEHQPIPLLKIDEAVEKRQAAQLARLRSERDSALVQTRLAALRAACEAPPVPGQSTIMPICSRPPIAFPRPSSGEDCAHPSLDHHAP